MSYLHSPRAEADQGKEKKTESLHRDQQKVDFHRDQQRVDFVLTFLFSSFFLSKTNFLDVFIKCFSKKRNIVFGVH